MRAIFCRTGSAIQSALARWNLTSAFEFTVEKGREHGSLRRSGTLSIWVAGAHQTLNHREVRRPPRDAPVLCELGETNLAVE